MASAQYEMDLLQMILKPHSCLLSSVPSTPPPPLFHRALPSEECHSSGGVWHGAALPAGLQLGSAFLGSQRSWTPAGWSRGRRAALRPDPQSPHRPWSRPGASGPLYLLLWGAGSQVSDRALPGGSGSQCTSLHGSTGSGQQHGPLLGAGHHPGSSVPAAPRSSSLPAQEAEAGPRKGSWHEASWEHSRLSHHPA